MRVWWGIVCFSDNNNTENIWTKVISDKSKSKGQQEIIFNSTKLPLATFSKNQDQVKLQLFKLHHDDLSNKFQNGEILEVSSDVKINNSNKEIRFKMNMNEYLPEEILENGCPTFANLRVIRVDKDINPLSFDQCE